MARCSSKISNLPPELLAAIAKRLPTGIDRLRFRAVCYSFRNAVPPKKPPHPLKVPDPVIVPTPSDSSTFFTNEFTVYVFQPKNKISNSYQQTTKIWMVNAQELSSGNIHLEDPFFGYVTDLSKLKNKSFNLLDYQVKEVAKFHRSGFVEGKKFDFFQKVVLSKCLDEIDNAYVGFAMMILNHGVVNVWRNGDRKWTIINNSLDVKLGSPCFQDIAFHNQKFYSIDSKGLTVTVDCDSLKVTQVVPSLLLDWDDTVNFLVSSLNDLYLIVRRRDLIQDKLFKLDEEKHRWVQVLTVLGDRLLFVNDCGSFSLSAEQFKGCQRNCIYLANERFGASVLDFEEETDNINPAPLSDVPDYFRMFFPPAWLKLTSAPRS